ncbi:MAG: hypothetical protein II786_04825 [Muribaculaceae bacterium]|nr:hypothetical protein [Muribaculaceae bacterium]MBR3100771.1 hypothetical protein [Muribaculaceae bacterium]
MKREEEDIKLAEMLKQEGHQAETNEWFTPRVLNRLPARSKGGRIMARIVYAVAFIICALCWFSVIKGQDFNVITTRDLINFAALAAVTVVLVAQSVITLVQRD